MRSFPGFNIVLSVLYFCFVVFSLSAKADELDIQIEIPAIDASPYHRPYVAIWLETAEREGVETIAVWHEQEEWLRDMRQWWRKLGRSKSPSYDAVTGATPKPDTYSISWKNETLSPGTYYLNFEAAREEGGRDYLRQAIHLGENTKQNFTLKGKKELGVINISLSPN